jgi:hypothetical protein
MEISELLKKWDDVLNEGSDISNLNVRKATAIMLENQHNFLMETTALGAGADSLGTKAGYATSGMFHKIAVPMVRRTFPELVAHDLVGVQPMTGPVGLAFALRFRAGTGVAGSYTKGDELGYNTIESDYSGSYITSAGESLGSKEGTGVGNDQGLGIGTGTHMREVNMTVEKAQIEAKTRKLRARWSLEVAQDLKAMHGLNLEEEMMDILAYEITAEIDRELIEKIDAVCVAGGANYNLSWSYVAASGTGVPGGRWEMERYRELYHYILRRAQQIAINTRRGSGNWIVGNPYSVAIFESMAAFAIAPVPSDVNTAAVGISRIGSLDGRLSVYRDTFQDSNQFILGYKGPSEYDTGVIYLPYIQLLASRATFEDSFQPAVGLMSRYGLHDHLFGSKNYYQKVRLEDLPV